MKSIISSLFTLRNAIVAGVGLCLLAQPLKAADEQARRQAILGADSQAAGGGPKWAGEQLGSPTTIVMDSLYAQLNPDIKKAFDLVEPKVRADMARINGWIADPPRDEQEVGEALRTADRCAGLINVFNRERRECCIKRLLVLTNHLAEASADRLIQEYQRKLADMALQAETLAAVVDDISAKADKFNRGEYTPDWCRLRRRVPAGVVACVRQIVENAVRAPLPGQTPAQAATATLSVMTSNLQRQLEDLGTLVRSGEARLRENENHILTEILNCGREMSHIETTARSAEQVAFRREMLEHAVRSQSRVNKNFPGSTPKQ